MVLISHLFQEAKKVALLTPAHCPSVLCLSFFDTASCSLPASWPGALVPSRPPMPGSLTKALSGEGATLSKLNTSNCHGFSLYTKDRSFPVLWPCPGSGLPSGLVLGDRDVCPSQDQLLLPRVPVCSQKVGYPAHPAH